MSRSIQCDLCEGDITDSFRCDLRIDFTDASKKERTWELCEGCTEKILQRITMLAIENHR